MTECDRPITNAEHSPSRHRLTAVQTIAIAAVVALAFLQPTHAQNDEAPAEHTVAQAIEDAPSFAAALSERERTPGAARAPCRARYFPANPIVDRWLRSTEIEVGGGYDRKGAREGA